MRIARKSAACVMAAFLLAALLASSFAQDGDKVALASRLTPGFSFARQRTLTVSLAVAPAAEKTAGLAITFTRKAEKTARLIEVEAGAVTKAFVDVKSSVLERECSGFGRKTSVREPLDGVRFEISTAEGLTSTICVSPPEAAGLPVAEKAALRVNAFAALRENDFLPGESVTAGREWTVEGPALSGLLDEAGFQDFIACRARFRFAGPAPGIAGGARIEIVSLHAEGGEEEQGLKMMIDGAGEILFDLARGAIFRFSCSGEASLKDLVSGSVGTGRFEAVFTTTFK